MKTFPSAKKTVKTITTTGKVVVLKNDVKFIARLLSMASCRNLDMKDIVKHSLRKFPPPFATCSGKLVKTQKAKLMHAIEDRVENSVADTIPPRNALILDVMAMLKTRDKHKKYREAPRERARGGITLISINGDDQKMPRQFKSFLSAGPNEVALVDFIFDFMVRNLDKIARIIASTTIYICHQDICHKFFADHNGIFLFAVQIDGGQNF